MTTEQWIDDDPWVTTSHPDIVQAIDQRCPHCEREWHTRPLTRQMLEMYTRGAIWPSYFIQWDHSPVLCDGSGFIGPLRPEPPAVVGTRGWGMGVIVDDPLLKVQGMISSFLGMVNILTLDAITPEQFTPPWTIFHDEPCTTDLVVEFGPQNWDLRYQPVASTNLLTQRIEKLWDDFTQLPMPQSSGYDFTRFSVDTNRGPTWVPIDMKGSK